MTNTNTTNAEIFLTDYASYNQGTQFQFGHWVNLEQFSDVEEFSDYVENHFKEADKKAPLDDYGSTREEHMITDFQGFPEGMYQESGSAWIEEVYKWIDLEEDDKVKFEFMTDDGQTTDYALEHLEEVYLYEYNTESDIYTIFEMYYPEAEEQERQNEYLTIDYDSFRRTFNEFTDLEGNTYLVEPNY